MHAVRPQALAHVETSVLEKAVNGDVVDEQCFDHSNGVRQVSRANIVEVDAGAFLFVLRKEGIDTFSNAYDSFSESRVGYGVCEKLFRWIYDFICESVRNCLRKELDAAVANVVPDPVVRECVCEPFVNNAFSPNLCEAQGSCSDGGSESGSEDSLCGECFHV